MSRRRGYRDDLVNLPMATCRVCGSGVREGSGVTLPDHQAMRRFAPGGSELVGGPTWLRSHDDCAKMTVAAIVGKLIGEHVKSDDLAQRAVARAGIGGLIAARRDLEEPCGRPFDFVTRDERMALKAALAAVRAEGVRDGRPRPGRNGACGVCGVRLSSTWWSGAEPGHARLIAWNDGTDASLCERCADVWRAAGRPTNRDDVRDRYEADLAGQVPQLGVTSQGLRFYAETAGEERRGFDQRWSYSPALAELRETLRMAHPAAIIDPLDRAFYSKVQAVRRARTAAARAEAERPGAGLDWTA